MKHIDIAREVARECRQGRFVPDFRVQVATLNALIAVYDRLGAAVGLSEPDVPPLPISSEEVADLRKVISDLTGEPDEADCN